MLIKVVVFLSFIYLTLRLLRECFSLYSSIIFLKNKDFKDSKANNFFYLLIPVLREQSIIAQTMETFASIDYPKDKFRVILITTSKEEAEHESSKQLLGKMNLDARHMKFGPFLLKYNKVFNRKELNKIYKKIRLVPPEVATKLLLQKFENYQTTQKIIQDLIKSGRNRFSNFNILKCLKEDGNMADQLNYAMECVISENKKKNFLFGVYNADSSPGRSILKIVNSMELKVARGSYYIFQQSSLFTKEFSKEKNLWRRMIRLSAGIYQSFWTLSHEIPRIQRYTKSLEHNRYDYFSSKMAHCVGHGMFFKKNIIKKYGFLPSETMNEDLPFGMLMSYEKVPIISIPKLENSESPSLLRQIIKQKSTWFMGILDYIKLYKNHSPKDKRFLYLTLKGLFNGLDWMAHSYLVILILILGFWSRSNIYIAMVVLYLFIFLTTQFMILFYANSKMKNYDRGQSEKITIEELLFLPFFSTIIMLSDSFGPARTTFCYIKSLLTKKKLIKDKTER